MINKFLFPKLLNAKLAFIIFLSGLFIGILTRVLMIFLIEFNFTVGDTATYIANAHNIIEFGIYGIEQEATVYRPPVYSFFIASIMFIFGDNILFIQIIQILIGLFIGILITRISAIHFPSASPWVFFLAIISPFEAVYATALLSEILASLFLVLTAFFLLTFNGLKKWIFGGISLGLCCLTRDIYLFLGFFIIVIWFILCSYELKSKITTSMTLLFSIFIIITPWTIRNYYQKDSFIPVSEGRAGYVLWMGTWAKNGNFTKEFIGRSVIFPPEAPLTNSEKIFFEKNLASMIDKTFQERDLIDSMFYDMAIERIKTKPLEVLKTYFIRSPLLWLGTRFDIFTLNKKWMPRESMPWYSMKVFFYAINFTFIFLGFVGIILISRQRSPLLFLTIPLIYTALIYLPFPSFENRYSQPVYPFILIFAGIALSVIFKKNTYKITS